MKTGAVSTEFEARAADALRALLGRFSAIKLIELQHESQPGRGFAAIHARIEICGHRHSLACQAHLHGEPARLRTALCQVQHRLPEAQDSLPEARDSLRQVLHAATPFAADAIPIVIAPHLSPEAQELCKQNKIGFLDFQGNARLTVGDFFIVMRSLPRKPATRVSAASQKSPAGTALDRICPHALPKISHKQPEPVGAVGVPA
jgi:hypothetical protein